MRRYSADPRNVDTTQDISLVIDGRTLTMALAPDLQDRFMELAKRCRSVLCCRVTPLQKSRVVRVVREKLKVMTLAIGESSSRSNDFVSLQIGILFSWPLILKVVQVEIYPSLFLCLFVCICLENIDLTENVTLS